MPTSSTSRKRKNPPDNTIIFLVALPIVFLLGLLVGYSIWGRAAAEPQTTAAEAGDLILGPENAPITLIEYSDYQCPFCKRWHDQVFSQLMADYPNQIRFVYRDFPLMSIHPGALPAAEAANCAAEQDAYYPYHEALFSNQYNMDNTGLLQYAADLGLDTDAFRACLNSQRYRQEVLADLQYGMSIGVQSTPTFIINGTFVIGAQPYDVFKQVIDAELARLAQP
jgi:protein-disulfide isomerase